MNCQECYDYIDAYIDNELDVAATILVKQHLRDCVQMSAASRGPKGRGSFARQSAGSI